ncbi:hypothetical protein O4H52_07075 [Sphingomonadaceae bacterium G21617-S1]|nr:hypothetical protein [Sphingomonadaceae bacterium G21617-S1]
MDLRQILYGVLMWGVFIYALRRGEWAERLAAGSTVAAAYLTVVAYSPVAVRFQRVETLVLLIDAGLVILFLIISLRSHKFWPLWLTAIQMLTVFAHLSPFVPHMLPWGYWRAGAVWGWLKLIVLALVIHRAQATGTDTAYK